MRIAVSVDDIFKGNSMKNCRVTLENINKSEADINETIEKKTEKLLTNFNVS